MDTSRKELTGDAGTSCSVAPASAPILKRAGIGARYDDPGEGDGLDQNMHD